MFENIFNMANIELKLLSFALLAAAVLIAVTFHECAHAAAAYFLGDDTAKKGGRLSLNPIRHLDPVGTIMFVLFRFGWGKPVPVDSRYFSHPRWGMAAVSLAGPASNFVLAFLLGMVFRLGFLARPEVLFEQQTAMTALLMLSLLVEMAVQINIVLGVFNLFPLPPLDGSRLVSALLPESLLRYYQTIEGYGVAVVFLMIFIFPGLWSGIFSPFINFFQRLLLV